MLIVCFEQLRDRYRDRRPGSKANPLSGSTAPTRRRAEPED